MGKFTGGTGKRTARRMREKAEHDSVMPSVSTWRTTGAKKLGSVPPAAVSVSQYVWPRVALFVGRGGGEEMRDSLIPV